MRMMFIGLLALFAAPTLAQSQSPSNRCADPRLSPNQALEICTGLIRSGTEKPNSLAADYGNRALAYLKLGMNDKAIADANRSLAMAESSNAHINRGGAYSHKGQLQQAIADYTRALALPADTSPALNANGHAFAYNNRGGVYGAMGRYNLALADFNQAMALAPRFVDPYINRALVNERVGSRDKAAADYRTALRLDPRNAKALAGLARLGLNP
jgi:tetratricopeptide (TPR) repeat protein